ncbi:MAG TPA: hypothetical protein VGK58_03065 [Lacipirellulaceae bacterium]
MLPATRERVRENTAEEINQQIRQRTECNIMESIAGGPKAIERRLDELDREWDIERTLETMAPTLSLIGLALGVTKSRKWLVVPAVVQSFFLQHALQGWCPPVPVLRRLGFRTPDEINEERYALKALRGDFKKLASRGKNLESDDRVVDVLAAVRH